VLDFVNEAREVTEETEKIHNEETE